MIKKISQFLYENQGKKCCIEFCSSGWVFDENDTYTFEIIDKTKNIELIVYNSENNIVFDVYESWFNIPTKKKLEKLLLFEDNSSICHYYEFIKAPDKKSNMLVIGHLSVLDYKKVLTLLK